MPTWGELLSQIASAREAPIRVYDEILRQALSSLSEHLHAPVILYASGYLQKESVTATSLSAEDLAGFMEVIHGIRDNRLFLVLHSPGGSSEAAESIVNYLRSKFRRIEAVVPHQAKSAASMLACAADRIWMARHSELGPIDPQFILQTPLGWRAVPAQSILNQFKKAAAAIMNDQAAAVLWYPMLSQYGPGLLDEAEKAVELSEVLVGSWLSSYMFRRRKHGNDLAKGIARFLSDYDEHKTHGRPLGYSVLKERGLIVRLIEQDQALQDRVLTVYHAAMHAFANTPAAKIILNHQGSAAVRLLSS